MLLKEHIRRKDCLLVSGHKPKGTTTAPFEKQMDLFCSKYIYFCLKFIVYCLIKCKLKMVGLPLSLKLKSNYLLVTFFSDIPSFKAYYSHDAIILLFICMLVERSSVIKWDYVHESISIIANSV